MAKLHFHLESKAIRSALYFAATMINRNALINRDASATTKSNVRVERNKTRPCAELIISTAAVTLAATDKTNERRGAC